MMISTTNKQVPGQTTSLRLCTTMANLLVLPPLNVCPTVLTESDDSIGMVCRTRHLHCHPSPGKSSSSVPLLNMTAVLCRSVNQDQQEQQVCRVW